MPRKITASPVARFFILAACFVIIIAGLKAGASILAPAFFALLVAVAIVPIIHWLDIKGLSTWAAVLIVVLVGLMVGVALIFFIAYSLSSLADKLPVYQKNFVHLTSGTTVWLARYGIEIPRTLPAGTLNVSRVFSLFGSFLRVLAGGISSAFLILLLFVVFSIESPRTSSFVRRKIGSESPTVQRFIILGGSITSYFRVRALNNLFVSVTLTILLFILGVDLAGLWGVLAFFLGFIPNIGLALAVIPAVVLALLERGWVVALIVIIGAVVLNSIGDNVLTPRLAGKALNMSTATIFLSFIFWAWVFGPLGALISVPLTAIVVAALDTFDETRWIAAMMSAEEITSSPEQGVTVPIEKGGGGEGPEERKEAA